MEFGHQLDGKCEVDNLSLIKAICGTLQSKIVSLDVDRDFFGIHHKINFFIILQGILGDKFFIEEILGIVISS